VLDCLCDHESSPDSDPRSLLRILLSTDLCSVFDTIADLAIFAQTPKVLAWRAALAERESICAAVKPNYPERLRAFLKKRGSHLSLVTQRDGPCE
jgi:hypothetical protein